MKYLVTGGIGFIGRNIVSKLLDNKHEVIIVDNQTNSQIIKSDINCEFYNIDIRDKEKLIPIIKDIDGIFHQASLIDVQESFQKPELYYDVNVLGSKIIFELAIKYSIKVVFASSASVYGDTASIPIKENNVLNPIHPYGKTKQQVEELASSMKSKGLNSIGLRYFNVFGIGQTSAYAGVILKFFEKLRNRNPPTIFGDGNQIRDFVYVCDIAQANLLSMKSSEYGIYNIGSGKGTKILDLANSMINLFGFALPPNFEPAQKNDIKNSIADISLAKNLLNWNPQISLNDWISTQL